MGVYLTNKCKTCSMINQCIKSRVREIFEPVDWLMMKMKADFLQNVKFTLKKRGNLNESHFGLLQNACNFQKLNITGNEKCKKRTNNTYT